MKETVERNGRFYTNEKGEIKTENEQLKEWLIIANKENERLAAENKRLNNILDKFEEELEKEINIKEEDVEVEHERFVAIHDTLENVLSRFLLIKGVEPLTENDKKQVKWLKDELKVGDDEE